MANKGGARHFSKPWIEPGLLLTVLTKHQDLVKDFGDYEVISAQGAASPKGLITALEFILDLLEICPACELHPQPLRTSLLRLLTSRPNLNTSTHAGSVWVHQRAERVAVVLGHMRRLARGGVTNRCAGELTAHEMKKLTTALEKVQLRNVQDDVQGKVPLKNGTSPSPKKRTLKKKHSEISVDSQGFPMELKTPENKPTPAKVTPEKVSPGKVSPGTVGPSRLLQKRHSQGRLLGKAAVDPGLREDLALGSSKLKKPAAAEKAALKKPAAAKATVKGKVTKASDHRPWLKISTTVAKKPERAYLLGTKEMGEKSKLIVEVSKVRSKQYLKVIEKIKQALKKENLSKDEAIDLRSKLCLEYP